MKTARRLPDITSSLVGRFSPYLRSLIYDFSTNSIEFQLLDRVEEPSSYQVLRFERLRDLQITPHDPEDADPDFIDSIIAAQGEGADFHFHTDRFSVSFSCSAFSESDCNAG